MDKNNDGLIPREDFIDGIMKTSKQMVLLLTVLPSCLCTHVLVRNITGFGFNPVNDRTYWFRILTLKLSN